MVSNTLDMFLQEVGILEDKPKKVTHTLPIKKEVKYVYNDPRDPITGEVPF